MHSTFHNEGNVRPLTLLTKILDRKSLINQLLNRKLSFGFDIRDKKSEYILSLIEPKNVKRCGYYVVHIILSISRKFS